MLDAQESLLYHSSMRSCLAIIVFILVLAALILSLLYNIFFMNSLSFDEKEKLPDYINTRRSYRPPAGQEITPQHLEKLPLSER